MGKKKMPGCVVSFSLRFSTLSASLLMDWMLSEMTVMGLLQLLEMRRDVCGEEPTEDRFTRELILPPVWSERSLSLSRSEPAERDLIVVGDELCSAHVTESKYLENTLSCMH
jgi:hypothetical protein